MTFSFQLASGQNAKPEWQFAAVKNADNNIVIHIEATIPAGTILYSGTNSEEYPGTTVVFDSSIKKQIEIISVTEQGALKKKDAQLDNAMVAYFEKKFSADVIIRIKNELPVIKGNVSFMGFNGTEFTGPDLAEFYFKKQADGNYSGGKHILTEATGKDLLLSNIDLKNPVSDCGVKVIDEAHSSLFSIFLLGFLGGLFALITPCVFPMIPLTVSFFTKKEGDRSKGVGRAFLYGLFIFLIYLSLSIPFQVAGKVNPEIYNNISTNVYLNLFFFVIFVVFAISFFGYFEITLPSSLANKADSKRGKGILGIFFMALTLAIVSFSCTGPILGVLLAGTASQGPWPLTAGLAGFGLALGFPFALFALFPQWLSSLPRSGGWMTTVKVVLGFVELALALKFLSNADLVMHWGILKREIFFAIWILISLASFAYLMGWFSFKKEYVKAKIGIARKIIAFVFLAFALYLFPGVTNTKYANVSLVSGFPPPAFYSIYGGQKPLDDYFAALKLAKEKNRPVMIDFTGWSCVNCRKMEENVWPSEKVKEQMDKFILVSLYVDDKKNLPEEDQFIYKAKDGSSKKIITIGDKWATLQSENFNAVSQPWYVLISPDGKLLTPPVGYTPDKSQYAKWLACGYEAFLKSGK
ncbi:MAG: cytochrome c biogenesis protein CcdA [Ferruginibacter sp.]